MEKINTPQHLDFRANALQDPLPMSESREMQLVIIGLIIAAGIFMSLPNFL